MTHTKQQCCIAFINEKKNTEEPKITDNLSPQTILLGSLDRLYAELDDFEKLARKCFIDIAKQKTQKGV